MKAKDPEPQLPEIAPEEPNGSDPQFMSYLARNTRRVPGSRLRAKQFYENWCEDCGAGCLPRSAPSSEGRKSFPEETDSVAMGSLPLMAQAVSKGTRIKAR